MPETLSAVNSPLSFVSSVHFTSARVCVTLLHLQLFVFQVVYFISLCFQCPFSLSDCFSTAVWAESAEMGLPDGQTVAHQPPLWPSGHTGGSLDGEAWLWAGQILCPSRKGWGSFEEVFKICFTPQYLFLVWHVYPRQWLEVSCLCSFFFFCRQYSSNVVHLYCCFLFSLSMHCISASYLCIYYNNTHIQYCTEVLRHAQ